MKVKIKDNRSEQPLEKGTLVQLIEEPDMVGILVDVHEDLALIDTVEEIDYDMAIACFTTGELYRYNSNIWRKFCGKVKLEE